ncbi:contractile injection system protein, VgrG/Pvc8 family [Hydrogenophaga sp. UC242_50]|uniref:contractile injection system protein, VgrG/Pvc8 family n=1 Tax=unclassified Hydrogenophaga TaxID=2610897 RepID=UPI0036D2CFA5
MTPSTPRRGLTIRSAAIPEVNGVPLLEPLKLEGEEGLNTLFEYRLVLQSAEGGGGNHLDLNRFIGRELTCCLELEGQGSFVPGVPGGAGANQGAGVREISGLITEARYIGESGRHALVEFTLRPWLHLATLSTDCKVFQDQSPVEIIEAVLGEYPFAADKRLIERYPRRDYTVQYNESDYEFVRGEPLNAYEAKVVKNYEEKSQTNAVLKKAIQKRIDDRNEIQNTGYPYASMMWQAQDRYARKSVFEPEENRVVDESGVFPVLSDKDAPDLYESRNEKLALQMLTHGRREGGGYFLPRMVFE